MGWDAARFQNTRQALLPPGVFKDLATSSGSCVILYHVLLQRRLQAKTLRGVRLLELPGSCLPLKLLPSG